MKLGIRVWGLGEDGSGRCSSGCGAFTLWVSQELGKTLPTRVYLGCVSLSNVLAAQSFSRSGATLEAETISWAELNLRVVAQVSGSFSQQMLSSWEVDKNKERLKY